MLGSRKLCRLEAGVLKLLKPKPALQERLFLDVISFFGMEGSRGAAFPSDRALKTLNPRP